MLPFPHYFFLSPSFSTKFSPSLHLMLFKIRLIECVELSLRFCINSWRNSHAAMNTSNKLIKAGKGEQIFEMLVLKFPETSEDSISTDFSSLGTNKIGEGNKWNICEAIKLQICRIKLMLHGFKRWFVKLIFFTTERDFRFRILIYISASSKGLSGDLVWMKVGLRLDVRHESKRKENRKKNLAQHTPSLRSFGIIIKKWND